MKTANVLRLIWKEWREGWPVLAAFIVLPALVFPICRYFPDSYLGTAMIMAVLFGIPFTAVLWASEKGRMVKGGRDVLAAVLPVSPLEDWIACYIVPSIAVAYCGGWLYYLHSYTGVYFKNLSWWAGVTICVTAFMLCSFLSRSVSHILGITAGTIVVLWGFTGDMTVSPIGDSPFAIYWHRMCLWLPLALSIAALGASELRKAGPRRLKVFGIAILPLYALAMLSPMLPQLGRDIGGAAFALRAYRMVSPTFFGPRYSVHAIYPYNDVGRGPRTFIYRKWENRRVNGRSVETRKTREFPGSPVLVGVSRSKIAYLLDRRPGDKSASLTFWNMPADRTWSIRLRSVGGLDKGFKDWFQSVSVNGMGDMTVLGQGWDDDAGTRLLVRSFSRLGTGRDLALIDLKTGRCELLLVNASYATDKVTWTKDRAYLTGSEPAMEIDTKNFTVKPLLPGRSAK